MQPLPERNLALDEFPASEERWARYRGSRVTPQPNARHRITTTWLGESALVLSASIINRTQSDAIARGENRVLLVMATGQARPTPPSNHLEALEAGVKTRILFWLIAISSLIRRI